MFSKSLITLLALVAVAVSASAGRAIELQGYTFEQYLSDFNMKFDPSEQHARRAAFGTQCSLFS
jgi:hypothetical protein